MGPDYPRAGAAGRGRGVGARRVAAGGLTIRPRLESTFDLLARRSRYGAQGTGLPWHARVCGAEHSAGARARSHAPPPSPGGASNGRRRDRRVDSSSGGTGTPRGKAARPSTAAPPSVGGRSPTATANRSDACPSRCLVPLQPQSGAVAWPEQRANFGTKNQVPSTGTTERSYSKFVILS